VIGGHAINVYCEPRATLDVDFLVRKLEQASWRSFLLEEGFKLRNEGDNFFQFSPPYGVDFRVDLMLVNEPTFAKLYRTARRAICFGVEVSIPTPLNLIALKTHAIRYGPEERKRKDWLDIEHLVRAAGLDPNGEAGSFSPAWEHGDVRGIPWKNAHMMNDGEEMKGAAASYGLDLPVAPEWFSKSPKGSLEDGIQLSLLALAQAEDRPEVFAQRQRRMCDVEFRL